MVLGGSSRLCRVLIGLGWFLLDLMLLIGSGWFSLGLMGSDWLTVVLAGSDGLRLAHGGSHWVWWVLIG